MKVFGQITSAAMWLMVELKKRADDAPAGADLVDAVMLGLASGETTGQRGLLRPGGGYWLQRS